MKKFNFSYPQAFLAALVLPILLAMPLQLAHAYQIPTTASGTWTVVGGVAQKTTPSGVRVNIAITAPTLANATLAFSLLNNTQAMNGTGAVVAAMPEGNFLTPALPDGTNGVQLVSTMGTACAGSAAYASNLRLRQCHSKW